MEQNTSLKSLQQTSSVALGCTSHQIRSCEMHKTGSLSHVMSTIQPYTFACLIEDCVSLLHASSDHTQHSRVCIQAQCSWETSHASGRGLGGRKGRSLMHTEQLSLVVHILSIICQPTKPDDTNVCYIYLGEKNSTLGCSIAMLNERQRGCNVGSLTTSKAIQNNYSIADAHCVVIWWGSCGFVTIIKKQSPGTDLMGRRI